MWYQQTWLVLNKLQLSLTYLTTSEVLMFQFSENFNFLYIYNDGINLSLFNVFLGRVDDFSLLIVQVFFFFLLIEFPCTFFISYEILHIIFIIFVF